ncbi:MAG TPA: hypothetical protein VGE93_22535 [Bryobacteraceae bacterium]
MTNEILARTLMHGAKCHGSCVYGFHITLAYTMKDFTANDMDEYWDLLGLLLFSTFTDRFSTAVVISTRG